MATVAATTQGEIPVIILREGTRETKGKTAQRNNIMAVKLVGEILKSSLGPRGMDKMLVDTLGDVTITNDGATILKEMDIQHPAAKMMVEVAKSVDNEVGDGTTSAVILAAALIEKAEELINKGVHSTIIIDGYDMALEKALEFLDIIAIKVDPMDKRVLATIAKTSMESKLVSGDSPLLSEIAVDAMLQVTEKAVVGYKVDIDDTKIQKTPGGALSDTSLINGIVIDKEVVHGAMPKHVKDATIALLNVAIEIEKTEIGAEIRITDPKQMEMFLAEEHKMLKTMVDKIISVGAKVLICQKGIDDLAQHYLSKAGMMAVRRVKESDMNKLAKATGGKVITNIEDLTPSDLGTADLVEERKIEPDRLVFVEGCKNPRSVTIFIRGGSQRVVDEAERSMHDALMVVKDVVERPAIVAGGGAPEAYVASKLREWASTLSGREQLAVLSFADALETIPLTLATNAGMDPIDTITEIRSKQAQGNKWAGVDVFATKIADMYKKNILEPLSVKEQIIKSATEVSSMILRIDDVIAAGRPKEEVKPSASSME